MRNGPGLDLLSAEDLEALEARMRMRLLWLALGAVAVLVVGLGAGFHFMSRAIQRAELAAAARTDPAPKPLVPEPVAAAGSEMRSLAILPKEALVGAARDRTLQALGSLTATHLYQSYLNIGFLADAAENDAYTPADAEKFLATVVSLIETVDQQLARLPESTLDAEDARKLARMRQIVGLLQAQARELRAYWKIPETDKEARKDREARFQKAREEAWAGIKDLLDLRD